MGKESVTARERGRDGDRQREKSVREIGVWEREMLESIGEHSCKGKR